MERRADTPAALDRLVGAPISWGVCEVPGWGLQLPPDRVLAEMAELGLRRTELGPLGWLPLDGAAVRRDARPPRPGPRRRLRAARRPRGRPRRDPRARRGRRRQLAAGRRRVFVAALVTDLAWSAPVALDEAGWRRAGAHLREIADLVAAEGLELVLHPHVGTLVETAADVELGLAHTDVAWCFDTGHLLIGGVDPGAFVRDHGDRIVHVHLKDVDAALAAAVRDGTS